jgi:ornithine cyclodeaminase/alanine dehydrogenase-like protein (mu-crystallin family)
VLQRAMDATATATGEEGKLTTTAEEWLTRLMDTTSSSSSNGKGNGVCTWPRESKDCVTLFKSAGTAVQDLVIADRLVVAFQAKTV